jgi:N-acetylmuramic acid 6-phosphate etherase
MSESFIDARLTERRNPDTAAIDTASSLEIVDLIAAEDASVPAAMARSRSEIASGIDLIEGAFRRGGRLIYVGAGTSGRLGVLDATECPPTFRTPPEQVVGLIAGGHEALVRSAEGAEDDRAAGAAAMDTHGVSELDVVVGIAASGTTPYVEAALKRSRELGAKTASVSCSEPSAEMRSHSDVIIFVPVGPEVVTGSTRMKAGTATKLVLNTLSTGAMIRIGKVYGNLMVDLQAWSEKLVDRGERIVMEAAEVDRDTARAGIAAAGGAVKTAIVMIKCDVGREEAETRIEEHGGQLRPLVGPPPRVRARD